MSHSSEIQGDVKKPHESDRLINGDVEAASKIKKEKCCNSPSTAFVVIAAVPITLLLGVAAMAICYNI
jgi:hypothetical protein